MSPPIRTRVVLYAALPLLLPFGGLVYVAAHCEDDWCPGGMMQAAAYGLAFVSLVIGSAAYLSTRPLHGARVGLGAWCLALAVAGFVFMGSQLFERDWMVAMVWAWLSGCFLVAAIVLTRVRVARPRPRTGDAT